MEIFYKDVKELHFYLVHDRDEGIDEISPFMNSLVKIKKEVTKAGFRNMFSKQEREIWLKIFEMIIIDEAPKDKVSKEADSRG